MQTQVYFKAIWEQAEIKNLIISTNWSSVRTTEETKLQPAAPGTQGAIPSLKSAKCLAKYPPRQRKPQNPKEAGPLGMTPTRIIQEKCDCDNSLLHRHSRLATLFKESSLSCLLGATIRLLGQNHMVFDAWLSLTRLTPTCRETFLLLRISRHGIRGAGSYVVLPILSDKENSCHGAPMATGIKDGLGEPWPLASRKSSSTHSVPWQHLQRKQTEISYTSQ